MKKYSKLTAVFAALVMVAVFVGCGNGNSDPLSGKTYKLTSMVQSNNSLTAAFSMSGTTLTITLTNQATQASDTATVTKNSNNTYSITNAGNTTTVTQLTGWYSGYELFEGTLTFNDGVCTSIVAGNSQSGTYSINGNSGTITLDNNTQQITSSNNWQTFNTNIYDSSSQSTVGSATYTRQ